MKKKLMVALAVLLAASGLFAQGSKEQGQSQKASGPVEITFWSLFTGGDGEFFDAMVDEFNKSQNEVVMKNDTVKFDNYYTKLTTALAAKNAPDVVVCHQANLMSYAPNGAFVALDDYVSKDVLDDFPAAPLDACRYDGKLYSLPLDVHPIVMYYNTDILGQAGITKLPVTADEFLQAAKQVKEKTGKWGMLIDNTTGTYKAYTLFRLFYSMIYQQNGTFLTDDNKAAAFNTEAGAKALDWLKAGVADGVNPNGLDYDAAMNMFKLGDGAFYFNGVWATGTLEKVDGLHFQAAPLPALMGPEPWAWGGSHTLAVPVQKKMDEAKIKAAVTFIEWMTSHGEMWAKAGHIPVRSSVQKKEAFKALPYRPGYAGAAGYVKACPGIPAWEEIYGTCSDLLEAAVTKNQDTKTALANMEKTVNDILAKY